VEVDRISVVDLDVQHDASYVIFIVSRLQGAQP
jgi:hypothetical protein